MQVTKQEREIMDHRLSIPECIAEVLSDDPECYYSEDDLHEAIQEIEAVLETKGCLIEKPREIHKSVLVELIEGSTWCAVHVGAQSNGEIKLWQLANARRDFKQLAEKISQHTGRKINRLPLD